MSVLPREGIAIAKTQGSYKGRKPIQTPDFTQTLLQWRSGEIKAVEDCECPFYHDII